MDDAHVRQRLGVAGTARIDVEARRAPTDGLERSKCRTRWQEAAAEWRLRFKLVRYACSHVWMAHSHENHIVAAFLDAYPFDDEATTVLDFACGKGLTSRGLAPHCKRIVAVDKNPDSVKFFAEQIQNQGIPSEEMNVVCTELQGLPTELDGEKFDVVVCSAAYHHLESISDTTRTLAFFLKPHGHLLVVDFLTTTDPIPEDVPHKFGFSEKDIRTVLDAAGLLDFGQERLKSNSQLPDPLGAEHTQLATICQQ
uniref:Methyltransferase type 11 domain-containing protein n=1 Tax=Mycena chlorophos TaxID=658473 RepID=A0ABQ0LTJ4_MYCCL|nr:predicted protein [Mycena chlorophos]